MPSSLVIGIDLDNTIIDYDNAFKHAASKLGFLDEAWINNNLLKANVFSKKTLIKKHILSLEMGNYKWESLQGQVYGNFIHHACLFPGVANFLLHSHRRGNKIFVVSHKTEFGHHDQRKTSLRKASLKFLEVNGIFSDFFGITKKDIFFSNTRKKKVSKISKLKCDYFIDDLPEVFEELTFPPNTKKILFNNGEQGSGIFFDSWFKINDFLFQDPEPADVLSYVEKQTERNVESVKKIKGRNNSKIFKIRMKSGEVYAGKLYPDPTFDDRGRLEKETKAYNFLHENNIYNIPRVKYFCRNLNFGLYEWLNGSEVKKITISDIRCALTFVQTLAKLSKKTNYSEFSLASAACTSGKMIQVQIHERYKNIHAFSHLYPPLKDFLEKELLSFIETVLKRSQNVWPENFSTNLRNENQLLSPSDFGFHNSIRTDKGLYFIDFEYFGWDDPVKLTCDFILHPGMALTNDLKKFWTENMTTIFSHIPSFKQRLEVSYCLYGLCWCLILLNEFCNVEMETRTSVRYPKYRITQKHEEQLLKSKLLFEHVCSTYKDGFPYA